MRVKYIVLFLSLFVTVHTISAQTVRMANGTILQGEVTAIHATGLEILSATGAKTYTWDTLSWGTRFRYQPQFRANFDSILKGLPPSSRSRKPDPEEMTDIQSKVAAGDKAVTATPSPAPTPIPTASLLIWDHFSYATPDSFRTGGFPSKAMRAPDATYFHGLQFGPGRKDVVYLASDPKNASELRDLLLVYSPYDPSYTNVIAINGFKKGAGVVTFRKFPLKSRFGEIEALFDIEYMGLANDEERVTVSAQLSRGDQKCRFVLGGLLRDHAFSKQIIPVDGLIDLPMIFVALDAKTSPVKITGELLMSHLRLAPKDNMDNKLTIEILTEDGTLLQKEVVRMDEANILLPNQISVDFKKAEVGKTYRVKTAINLGSFLGPVTGDETVEFPAKQP